MNIRTDICEYEYEYEYSSRTELDLFWKKHGKDFQRKDVQIGKGHGFMM